MATFQIVTLGCTTQADGSFFVSGVFWLTAPPNKIAPAPSAKSVVPGILASDLAAIQSGTIVEQSFVTGQYTSGTAQATVDADIQARFTTAQAALTTTNPALATAILRAFNGVAWTALGQSAKPAQFSPTTAQVVTEVAWAAALGLVMGVTSGRSTGYVNTSAATPVKIRATAYTPQGTNAQRSLVSTSAADAAAGTGARTVTINYLDAAFVPHSETVTLNGVTAVPTVGTNIAYIESLVVATSGSGNTNAGTVSIGTTAAGGAVWGSIAVSDGMTMWAHHYVPAGVTCYPCNLSGGATVVSGRVVLQHTGDPSQANIPVRQVGGSYPHLAAGNEDHTFSIPIPIVGPDLLFLTETPNAATASVAFGTFEWIQF